MTEETRVDIGDGKYTIVHSAGTNLRVLRNGEDWATDAKGLPGWKFILAVAGEVEQLRTEALQMAERIVDLETSPLQETERYRFSTYMARGKSDWAAPLVGVTVTDVAHNVSVSVHSERSQHMNKSIALDRLQKIAALLAAEQALL